MADEANVFGARRTIATLDPATPVVSLGDKREYRRETLVCITDEERDLMATNVGNTRDDINHGIRVARRRAFYETAWGRAAILAAILGAVADAILTFHVVVSG